jgi:hypothetical protein
MEQKTRQRERERERERERGGGAEGEKRSDASRGNANLREIDKFGDIFRKR